MVAVCQSKMNDYCYYYYYYYETFNIQSIHHNKKKDVQTS